MMEVRERFQEHRILVVIPTYNNAGTIVQVIEDVQKYTDDFLVVNDGSTDETASLITPFNHLGYSQNKGKGYAIQRAIAYAKENGYDYILTIDSDGQHYASDFVQFLDALDQNPGALIIGARNLQADNMPSKNTFANKFSNFWYRIETGFKLSDTQSGFRLYPLAAVGSMRFFSNRYEFEVEIIVRAAWAGTHVMNVPIKVFYAPAEERISHFKPLKDFTRISILNTFLVTIALLYYYPKKAIQWCTLKNIKGFFRENFTELPDSNLQVASAIGLGIFFGIIPLWGYQMITAAFCAHRLRLNKVITLLASNISIPPMTPIILYGCYFIGGKIMGQSVDIELSNLTFERATQDFGQYLLGSVILSVLAAIIGLIISFSLLIVFRKQPDGKVICKNI